MSLKASMQEPTTSDPDDKSQNKNQGCNSNSIVVKSDGLHSQAFPLTFAAPVEEGMMLPFTARPPLQSFLEGPSTVFWVAVEA